MSNINCVIVVANTSKIVVVPMLRLSQTHEWDVVWGREMYLEDCIED
jgi:hypothetical protein